MLKQIGEKDIFSGKYLKFTQLELENGKIYEISSRIGDKNSVAGLIVNIEKKVFVLIEQYRYPVKSNVIELVAGLIDKDGKTEEQIMIEEVMEETGYNNILSIKFIGNTSSAAGQTTEITKLFCIEVSGERGEQKLGELEDIKVLEIPFESFQNFINKKINSGIIIDSKVFMAMYLFSGKK